MKKLILIVTVGILLISSCSSESEISKPEMTTKEKVDNYTGPAVIIIME